MEQKDINKIEVGQRIKNIRLSKGMTLEEFGKIFNATKGNVLKWEKGQSLPNPDRLKWTRLIKNKDTTKDYCTTHDVETSKNYFVTHTINTKKEFYNVNQKEFEYIKSNKERLYDIFYKNILEYGYNENNNINIRIFNLSVYMLLKEYYISQEDNNFFRTTLIQTVSEAINRIDLSIVNATKQTTNVDDKLFFNQLLELTKEYTKNFNLICAKFEKNT